MAGVTIPPKQMRELYQQGEGKANNAYCAPEVLAKCKAKLVAPSGYKEVWTSQGTQSANRISVWAPDLEGSI